MEALSGPLLLVAPALHAGEAKHSRLPTLGSQQQQQQQPQLLLLYSSHRRHLPLAQLEQIEVVAEPSSSTSTLVHTPKLTDFTLISLGLLLLFWIGNYVVPDYIFKKVFQPETGNGNEKGDTSADDKQRVLGALVGGQNSASSSSSSSSSSSVVEEEEGTTTATTVKAQGFGQPPKPVGKGRKEKK